MVAEIKKFVDASSQCLFSYKSLNDTQSQETRNFCWWFNQILFRTWKVWDGTQSHFSLMKDLDCSPTKKEPKNFCWCINSWNTFSQMKKLEWYQKTTTSQMKKLGYYTTWGHLNFLLMYHIWKNRNDTQFLLSQRRKLEWYPNSFFHW